jgi:predicted AlkP superfamily phosphohydrolase/phosphomutase
MVNKWHGTVILGLDGATWKVLKPLAKQGIMPNLAKIMRHSAYGLLMSTDPPITGAAWLAIASGLNPGKTGVIDFFVRTGSDSFEFRFVNSSDYYGRSYWDFIEALGGSCGVAFYPTLYPPYKLRGFMISGFGVPSDELHTWPPSLVEELRKVAPGFVPVIEPRHPKYSNLENFIEDMRRHLKDLERIARYLLTRYHKLDSTTFIVSASDWIQHRAWHILHSHPLSSKLYEKKHKKEIEELYTQIDDIIRLFHEYAEAEEKLLLMISDHGFQHHTRVFNLALWLKKKKTHESIQSQTPKILGFPLG